MKTIAAAMVKAQKEFSPALKTSTNPHFRSRYVSLDGCVEAVIDALNNNGIFLMQKSHDCDNGVKVETIFIHESGEELSGGILHVPAQKQDAQGYGSALTYARRYGLMAACGIAPEDDDGNAASAQAHHPQAKPKPAIKPIDDAELEQCIVALGDADSVEALQAIFGAAWSRLSDDGKAKLKQVYDKHKTKLETK